MEAFPTI